MTNPKQNNQTGMSDYWYVHTTKKCGKASMFKKLMVRLFPRQYFQVELKPTWLLTERRKDD